MPESRSPSLEVRRAIDGHWDHDGLWRRLRRQSGLLSVWTSREYQIRYRQSALGFAWSLLQPLALLGIYGSVLSLVLQVPTEGFPYISFAYAGLVGWAFVSTAVSTSFPAIIQALPLVSKVYFPREVIPLGVVCASTVDLLIGTFLLIGMTIVQGIGLNVTLLGLFAIDAMLFVWLAAVCVAGSALTVFVRDLRHAIPVALQLFFFASPVMYPASLFPEQWRWIHKVNPVAVAIEATRDVALRHVWPDWKLIAVQSVAGCLAAYLALAYTRSVEPRLVDVA